MSWGALIQPTLEWLWRLAGVATHVRVRAHRTTFESPAHRAGLECLFITVSNLLLSRVPQAGFVPGGALPVSRNRGA